MLKEFAWAYFPLLTVVFVITFLIVKVVPLWVLFTLIGLRVMVWWVLRKKSA